MLNIKTSTAEEFTEAARQLYIEYRTGLGSFEEAANLVVTNLFDTVVGPDGNGLFALFRIFRFGQRDDIHPDLQGMAQGDEQFWLTLMATRGIEDPWCDRRTSQGHQVIPADTPVTPMLQGAFQQIGLQFGESIGDSSKLKLQGVGGQQAYLKYFHVEEVPGSEFVPAQEEFVQPYNIRSAIGIGSILLNNSAFFSIGFTLYPLDQEGANKIAGMTPFIGTLLSTYNTQVWAN